MKKNINYVKSVICFFLFLSITGCSTLQYRPVRADNELTGLNLNLDNDAGKLKDSANVIDSETTKIKVKQEATKILVVANDLLQKDLTAKKIKEYTESLEAKIEALMNDKNKKLDNFFFWGIVLGSVIFAGGIAFIILCYAAGVPNLAGLALQITLFGGSICLFSGVAYYYFWLGVTGIAVLVAVFIILIIVKAIKDNKSLLEIVRSNEVLQTSSPATQKTVEKIRKKDKLTT